MLKGIFGSNYALVFTNPYTHSIRYNDDVINLSVISYKLQYCTALRLRLSEMDDYLNFMESIYRHRLKFVSCLYLGIEY